MNIQTIAQQIVAANVKAQLVAQEDGAQGLRRVRQTRIKRTGKYKSTGLRQALLERLPTGKENAMTVSRIRDLVADIQYHPQGLCSSLAELGKLGCVKRVGTRGSYRFYIAD